MTTQEKDDLKSHLEEYVVQITEPGKNKGFYICPLCGSGRGKKQTGAFHLTGDKRHFKCFSCGAGGDLFDLIGQYEHITEPVQIFQRASQLFGREGLAPRMPQSAPLPATRSVVRANFRPYLEDCASHAAETEYFRQRGLSDRLVAACRLGYDPEKQLVTLPYQPDFSYYITRSVAGKKYGKPRAEEAGPEPIFHQHELYPPDGAPVFVTEGQFDCLSLQECGYHAVAIGGTGHQKLLRQLQQQPTPSPLLLCLDGDAPGRAAETALAAALAAAGIFFLQVSVCGGWKDPNEALVRDRAGLEAALSAAVAQAAAGEEGKSDWYLSTSAAAFLPAFLEEIRNGPRNAPIPTGFSALDRLLDGGLYDGLYILGAISSLGKTTFLLQMADQIAAAGRDVLIYSLEMSRTELVAKSISRLTYARSRDPKLAKTLRGVRAGAKWQSYRGPELDLLQESIGAYQGFADRVYIRESLGTVGVEEIRDGVEEHVRHTGNAPVVFLDYLQILSPLEPRSTDKQNTDRAVFALKRLSRDFHIPVFAISSLNRDSYTSTISMRAFKESGAIEYSSDVLLGLQFSEVSRLEEEGGISFAQLDDCKRKSCREVELKLLKNRNGQTGGSIPYHYLPMFNFFEEAAGAPSPSGGSAADLQRKRGNAVR